MTAKRKNQSEEAATRVEATTQVAEPKTRKKRVRKATTSRAGAAAATEDSVSESQDAEGGSTEKTGKKSARTAKADAEATPKRRTRRKAASEGADVEAKPEARSKKRKSASDSAEAKPKKRARAADDDDAPKDKKRGKTASDDDDEPKDKKRARSTTDPAKSSLLAYFRDMSANDLLTPQSEAQLAREIEARETHTWIELLSYPPVVDYAADEIGKLLEEPLAEFRALRSAATRAKKARTKGSQETLDRAARKVATKMRALDLDQSILDAVLGDLEELAEHEPAAGRRGKKSFSTSCRAYSEYLEKIQRRRQAAKRSRNQFVTANLGLVVSVARRYQHSGMPLTDLIQEGNLGLLKAVERFDHNRGYRFSTYATWWIRHSIGRAVADKARTVRVPVHVLEANQKINKSIQELSAKLGRQPTREELAEATEIPLEKLEKTRQHAVGQSVSLDAPLGEDGDRERLEVFEGPETEDEDTPFDTLATQSLVERVRLAMDRLQPIEVDVLRRRFGLDGEDEVTLQEIASTYGLSRERIRQIQEKALGKVRGSLRQERAI